VIHGYNDRLMLVPEGLLFWLSPDSKPQPFDRESSLLTTKPDWRPITVEVGDKYNLVDFLCIDTYC